MTAPAAKLAVARRAATTQVAAARRRIRHDCGAPWDPVIIRAVSELVGRVLADKYRLDAVLGRGGMGLVFAGEHVVTGRPIAVKVLRPEMSGDATLGRRFVREVKATAGLVHPNVVSVLDFGVEADGTAYQVLELLEGETLSDRLDRGRLTPARALELLLPIVHALEVAHARGIVHRDLKPDNVFLARNARGRIVPKLLDFGIAKVLATDKPRETGETHTTQLGTVIGTPAYMSPEQARGTEVGPPTDIWAISVVLFECLSGRVPFEDENASIMMARVMLERAPSLQAVAPDVPSPLARAVDAGLMHEPSERPPTMAALERLLRAGAAEAHVPLPEPGLSDCADDDPERRPSVGARALAPTHVSVDVELDAPRADVEARSMQPETAEAGEAGEDRTGPLGPLRAPRLERAERPTRKAQPPAPSSGPAGSPPASPSVRPAPTPVPRERNGMGWAIAAAVPILGLIVYGWSAGRDVESTAPPAAEAAVAAPMPPPTASVSTEPAPLTPEAPLEPEAEPTSVQPPAPAPAPDPATAGETTPSARPEARGSRRVRETGAERATGETTTGATRPEAPHEHAGAVEEAGTGLPGIREW